jgi:hypothetical protein
MRKSLLIACLSACLPMFAVDGEAGAAPLPDDAAPSSTEPVQTATSGNAAGGASQDVQSPALTSAADAAATASAEVAQAGESASGAVSQPALSTSSGAEAGNDMLPPAGASTAAELPADGTPLVPNADASPAASGPASDIASSVQIAPLDAGTGAAQPAIVHPAHSFADRIHSLAFTLEGSGDSMLSRMGWEIGKLVAAIKSVL